MSDTRWKKTRDGAIAVGHSISMCLTTSDLEEGLRVAREKPVFRVDDWEFQKQGGEVFARVPGGAFVRLTVACPQDWPSACLRAIADAMES